MLNEEICKLRNKLNESIVTGQDYSIIYQLSIELDELIAEYYRRNKKAVSQLITAFLLEAPIGIGEPRRKKCLLDIFCLRFSLAPDQSET